MHAHELMELGQEDVKDTLDTVESEESRLVDTEYASQNISYLYLRDPAATTKSKFG